MEEDLSQVILNSPHQLQAWFQSLEEQIAGAEERLEGYRTRFQALFPSHPPLCIDSPAGVNGSSADSPELSPIPLTRKDFVKSNIEAAKWRRKSPLSRSLSHSPRLQT
jgi:hypothetical protein